MAKTYIQALEEIRVKSDELATVFAEAGEAMDMDLVKSIEGDDVKNSADKVKWIQEREAELKDLNDDARGKADLLRTSEQNSQLKSVLDLLDMPSNAIAHALDGVKGAKSEKSFGEQFVDAWTPEMKGREFELEGFDVKTLFETTAGWLPESTRTGRMVDEATRPIQISDVIPFTTTGQAAVVYMEETTATYAAAEAAEGAAFAESTFVLTEVTSPVRKIAHFIPVTDEQLEDEPQVSGYLDNRMRFGLLQRLDYQLAQGDGIAPNLEGILNRAGIQTQAKGADPTPDAIFKAMTKVRVTGRAIPGAVLIHSTDWEPIRLLRTVDGIYIWGSPSQAGDTTIWGLPVVQNEVLTAGTALVGDFANFSEFAVRRGVTVKVSDSHSDYFVKGKQAIRADIRGALQCYRPAAFATVTGL